MRDMMTILQIYCVQRISTVQGQLLSFLLCLLILLILHIKGTIVAIGQLSAFLFGHLATVCAPFL